MTIKTGVMAAALLMLAGCNAPSQHAAVETCKADNQMQQTTLYFGLNRPAGAQITSNEWQQFVDQDVTPRFRDGLTVFDARAVAGERRESGARAEQGADADPR
jgi:hypothetical protein